MNACFMGLGYIGLPTAIIAARNGIRITGVDINPKVVETINQGKIHIVEPGLQELCEEVVKKGFLTASTTPEVSDAYFIVVPTPFKGNHEPDIAYVQAATEAVLPLLKEGDLYVIESTSPVGTTDKMRDLIFSKRPELSVRKPRSRAVVRTEEPIKFADSNTTVVVSAAISLFSPPITPPRHCPAFESAITISEVNNSRSIPSRVTNLSFSAALRTMIFFFPSTLANLS